MENLCPRSRSEVAEHAQQIERCLWGSAVHRSGGFAMQDDHIHSCYELFYLAQGSCRLFADDAFYTMTSGCAMLLPPGMLHHMVYLTEADNLRYSVYFGAPLLSGLRQCAPQLPEALCGVPVQLTAPACAEAERLFARLLQEQDGADVFSEPLCRRLLDEVLVLLARAGAPAAHRPPEADPAQSAAHRGVSWHEAMVQDTIHYLLRHYAEAISLEELAARVPISPAYFSKCFKKATGLGYKEYLIYIRMREAKRLLAETDLTIREIAAQCGYGSSNYFGDVFSAVVGTSPRQYRSSL